LVFISVLELLCFQKDTETKRRTSRKEEGVQMMKEGKMREAEIVIVTEDKIIEEMLTEEKSPPQKKLKLGTEKFSKLKKLVGTAENLFTPGVVTVSKYFAGGEKGKVKDSGNDDTEEV
jgi:hypothetical protein